MRIHTVDLEFQGRPHAIASYLIEGPEGPVLVETGPGSTLDKLRRKVTALGFPPETIRHVLVTHIHFDHAGAAGWWAGQGANVYVHPNGARHLVDPARLIASASRIYGDRMEPLWGEILPAPAERVVQVQDGQVLEVGGLKVRALDTPGHANHHLSYQLGKVVFTGDVAGIRLPGSKWVDLPAPPPEFDLEAWKSSLARIRELEPSHLIPTHYGATQDVAGQLDGVEKQLDQAVSILRRWRDVGVDRDSSVSRYRLWLKELQEASGVSEKLSDVLEVANPKSMSVDGILRYLQKRDG